MRKNVSLFCFAQNLQDFSAKIPEFSSLMGADLCARQESWKHASASFMQFAAWAVDLCVAVKSHHCWSKEKHANETSDPENCMVFFSLLLLLLPVAGGL